MKSLISDKVERKAIEMFYDFISHQRGIHPLYSDLSRLDQNRWKQRAIKELKSGSEKEAA